MKKIKINRYEYILNKYLKEESCKNYKEARTLIEKENKYFKFPKSNGDQININNIVGEQIQSNFVKKFYKSIDIYITEERKKSGELIYFSNLSKEEIKIRDKIKLLSTINKSIFDGKTSIYGIAMEKIKEKYKKTTTKKIDRSITSGKNHSPGNYSIEYKYNILIFSYERFIYEDIFEEENEYNFNKLENNIIKKYLKIKGLSIIEKIDNKFKEKFINKVSELKKRKINEK
jgi:hypothetical protein